MHAHISWNRSLILTAVNDQFARETEISLKRPVKNQRIGLGPYTHYYLLTSFVIDDTQKTSLSFSPFCPSSDDLLDVIDSQQGIEPTQLVKSFKVLHGVTKIKCAVYP